VDAKTKWLLKFTLSYKEALEVLIELYGGAKKILNYEPNKKLDKNLFKLYNDFNSSENSDFIINFSNSSTAKPFISITKIDGLDESHTIPTEMFSIYIYE